MEQMSTLCSAFDKGLPLQEGTDNYGIVALSYAKFLYAMMKCLW